MGRAERAGLGQQVAELELFVAHHARVRRAAGAVFAGEIIDDHLLELVRLVDDVVGNAERVRDAARVGDGLRAAAFVLRARDAILRPDLHGHADDVVALLLEQVGGDGRIDAAAHAEQDAGGKMSEPLRLFYSLRYTPSLFENLLREEGFSVELLALTSCREEAIWAVTAARPKI
jgi:hypothetical protein